MSQSIIRLVTTPYISNLNKPICNSCIHFMKYVNNFTYCDIPSDKLSKCSKFGTINLITGEIEYATAFICRKDDNKCGPDGLFFTSKNING